MHTETAAFINFRNTIVGVLFKHDLEKYYSPKFDPSGVQTHDLQIMDSVFHVLEVLVLITELSEIVKLAIWDHPAFCPA